jgi:hypothetical protein
MKIKAACKYLNLLPPNTLAKLESNRFASQVSGESIADRRSEAIG